MARRQYPQEFRQQLIALVREFEPSDQTSRRWAHSRPTGTAEFTCTDLVQDALNPPVTAEFFPAVEWNLEPRATLRREF